MADSALFQSIYSCFSEELWHRIRGFKGCRQIFTELFNFPCFKNILEVGTAEGIILRYLLRTGRVSSAVGYDISPQRIKKATSRSRKEHLQHRAAFMTGDGQHLLFDDDSFDVVLLPHVLEHVPTREQVRFLIRESMRVSRYGLLIALPLRDSREPVLKWSKYLDLDHLKGLIKYRNGWIYNSSKVEELFRSENLDFQKSANCDRMYIIRKRHG